jgi:hypothetical protein
MSEVTQEQKDMLNRLISEKRGLKCPTSMCGGAFGFDEHETPLVYIDLLWPNWSGDDRANCALLYELPIFFINQFIREEIVDSWGRAENWSNRPEVWRIAVCLAWCKWKVVPLEGIV